MGNKGKTWKVFILIPPTKLNMGFVHFQICGMERANPFENPSKKPRPKK